MYERNALLTIFNIFTIKFLCCFGIFIMKQLDNIHMVKYSIEDILKYIEDNGVTKTKDLPSNYLNYIYRYKLSDRLPFIQEKKQRKAQRIDSNRLQPWYDIEKILPFLERWSIEEGTTLEQQAIEGCLKPEWEQWCIDHPEYKGR